MRRIASAVAATFVFAACSVWSVASTATPACAAGAMRVAVVVDFNGARDTSVVCVGADSGAKGSDVLFARAAMLGLPSPQFNSVGLICRIDGYPDDCNVTAQRYWSYWLGDGAWTYSDKGPGYRHASADVVEGWRFENGVGSEGDAVPPRGSPVASDTCTSDAPPPPPPAPPTAPSAAPVAAGASPAAATPSPTPSAPGLNATTTTSATSDQAPATSGPTTTTTLGSSSPSSSRSSTALAAGAPSVTVRGRPSGGNNALLFAGSSAVVVAVIGAGVWQARRRRAHDS